MNPWVASMPRAVNQFYQVLRDQFPDGLGDRAHVRWCKFDKAPKSVKPFTRVRTRSPGVDNVPPDRSNSRCPSVVRRYTASSLNISALSGTRDCIALIAPIHIRVPACHHLVMNDAVRFDGHAGRNRVLAHGHGTAARPPVWDVERRPSRRCPPGLMTRWPRRAFR
jgi:hypothetical protein